MTMENIENGYYTRAGHRAARAAEERTMREIEGVEVVGRTGYEFAAGVEPP